MRTSTQKKRSKILNVATELFVDQGYKETSLDQIVAICGGSKHTIYRYFSNKEGLFLEVLSHNTKSNIDYFFQVAERAVDESLQASLENFAISYLNRICSKTMIGLFRIVSADFNKHDTFPREFWIKGPVSLRKQLIEFLNNNEEACKTLEIKDADLMCDQLLAMIKNDYLLMAVLGVELPSEDTLRIHVKNAVNSFLTLYRKQ